RLEQRRNGGEGGRLRPRLEPGQDAARPRHGFRRRAEPLLELRCERLRPDENVDLEEALEAPRLEIARPRQYLLPVAHERLGVEHRRVLEDANSSLEELGMVKLLRGRACPVVRVRGDE